ncbi:hypothetical protein GO730_00665 [Spirosoma sp. HMF3257]|uniref:Uncharacterized protein n=1 Tax=Spirosoma telluris TaxID=2183553 RepID=A0A327NDY1_9BACT|nr:hypothetical protein [Spirosoma telluris]RAI73312.1 hypothetical protein HMF3257_00650 [Spirosoma telluris]
MTNAVKKIVRSYFGKIEISMDGLMEIMEKTGNADVALDLLLGTYETPAIPKESEWAGHLTTFQSYDKWEDKVHFSYLAPDRENIWIDRNVDKELITPENYKEYSRSYTAPNTKMVTVNTSIEPVLHTSYCSLNDWREAAIRLQDKVQ